MDPTIANWGIELAFIRTKVGREFEVVDSLVPDETIPGAVYFSTYGHFDLVAIRTTSSLNAPYAVVLHRNVYESAPFRFFSHHEASKEKFASMITNAPAAIAVMAKIHPLVIDSRAGDARWRIASRIQERLPSAFVFFGLGFSEFLVIDTGSDFSHFLETVRELRGLTGKPDSDSPALSKTTTFPFVSYNIVHKTGRYDLLQGEVEPVITISCQPASERAMAQAIRSSGIIPKHIWGKNDLLLTWPQPVKFSDLVKFVREFRGDPELSNVLGRTSTYLETPVYEEPIEDYGGSVPPFEFMDQSGEQKLFSDLAKVMPHSLRASLSNLALRLSACVRSPLLTDYYRDMVKTFPYVTNLLGHLNGSDAHLARSAGVQAARVADIARAAINQRYAGLELHPETLAHSHSPLLCDIRTIVGAATCVPRYIFDRLFKEKRADEVWLGFVLFGGSYSPQWLDQDVLALPSSSLFTPIEEWWKVTHEAAHAVFRLTNVDQNLPTNWRAWLKTGIKNEFDLLHMVGEVFANWFDWKYIFRRDTAFYLQTIWRTWLDLPVVWHSKPQYFARSFPVLLSEDAEAIAAVSKEGKHEAVFPFIRKRWAHYQQLLRDIPNMQEFMRGVTEAELSTTVELVYDFYPIVRWFEEHFEERCGVPDLADRMAPEYAQLDRHVQDLIAGKIILDAIPDPPRLHVALLRALNHQPTPLETEIAYIYSFENAYLAANSSADENSALQH
jgi:hypothetical protein